MIEAGSCFITLIGVFRLAGETRFSLLDLSEVSFLGFKVRVVNGETISRNLDASMSILIAENAALADLPVRGCLVLIHSKIGRTYDWRRG